MARDLDDPAWAAICAAAEPFRSDGEARALLSAILFEEVPRFTYNSAAVAKDKARAKRMLNALARYEKDCRARFPDASERSKSDLWHIDMLRRRPMAMLLAAQAKMRASRGKKGKTKVQRQWLIHRLCGVWLEHFGADYLSSYWVPEDKPPGGPLVDFILTAMAQVMPPNRMPSPWAVLDGIKRDWKERDNATQRYVEQRQRHTHPGD
jgi:hypothetical protein